MSLYSSVSNEEQINAFESESIIFLKKNTMMTLGTVFNLEIGDYISQGIIQVN